MVCRRDLLNVTRWSRKSEGTWASQDAQAYRSRPSVLSLRGPGLLNEDFAKDSRWSPWAFRQENARYALAEPHVDEQIGVEDECRGYSPIQGLRPCRIEVCQ